MGQKSETGGLVLAAAGQIIIIDGPIGPIRLRCWVDGSRPMVHIAAPDVYKIRREVARPEVAQVGPHQPVPIYVGPDPRPASVRTGGIRKKDQEK